MEVANDADLRQKALTEGDDCQFADSWGGAMSSVFKVYDISHFIQGNRWTRVTRVVCRVIIADEPRYWLRHVIYHSPTGIDYGHGGSGSADLALSILADHLDERPTTTELQRGQCRCWAPHQDFKWAFLASMPRHRGKIMSDQIAVWLNQWHAARPWQEEEAL
jgi:hypothetical protein